MIKIKTQNRLLVVGVTTLFLVVAAILYSPRTIMNQEFNGDRFQYIPTAGHNKWIWEPGGTLATDRLIAEVFAIVAMGGVAAGVVVVVGERAGQRGT